MIFIDTDVFIIDLRYKDDQKYTKNSLFLKKAFINNKSTTSIFNVLEVCGILSFNLNKKQLYELFYYFPRKYNLILEPLPDLSQTLPTYTIGHIMDIISKKTSFGDSLISCYINNNQQFISHFISWNSRHFKERISIPAITPEEALKNGLF